MSGALGFVPGDLVFAAATEGTPAALENREVYASGSHETNNWRDNSWLPLPGHCTNTRLKHISCFSEKETYLLAHKSWTEGRFLFSTLAGSMEVVSWNGGN